jgi:hypothetical protein
VWDPDKNRWTNVDGDDEGTAVAPPPKSSESPAVTQGLLAAARPSGGNVFKLSGAVRGKTYLNKSVSLRCITQVLL